MSEFDPSRDPMRKNDDCSCCSTATAMAIAPAAAALLQLNRTYLKVSNRQTFADRERNLEADHGRTVITADSRPARYFWQFRRFPMRDQRKNTCWQIAGASIATRHTCS